MRKKCGRVLSAILVFLVIFSSFTVEADAKTKVTLNLTKLNLTVGKSAKLKVSTTGKNIKWISKNPDTVKITKYANRKKCITVKAKKEGTAEIVCKVGSVKKSCQITVKPKKLPIQDSVSENPVDNNNIIVPPDDMKRPVGDYEAPIGYDASDSVKLKSASADNWSDGVPTYDNMDDLAKYIRTQFIQFKNEISAIFTGYKNMTQGEADQKIQEEFTPPNFKIITV